MKIVSPETTDEMLVDRAEGRNIIHNYFGVQQRIAKTHASRCISASGRGGAARILWTTAWFRGMWR